MIFVFLMQNATEQSVLFWGDTDLNSKLDKSNQDILVSYFDFNYCWSTCIQHADLSFFWNSHLNEYRIYKIQCKYFRVHSAENRWNNFGHKQPKLSICIDLWWNSTSYPNLGSLSLQELSRQVSTNFENLGLIPTGTSSGRLAVCGYPGMAFNYFNDFISYLPYSDAKCHIKHDLLLQWINLSW